MSVLFLGVIIGGSAEILVRFVLDDGMQYDLEMWKYARQGKKLSDDPAIGHEHVDNAKFHAMGVDIEINSHGMRGPEVEQAKPADTFRILMVGDSLTFGWGVKAEETFSQRLEALLVQDNRRVEVLNTGIGNTNTPMQAQLFAAHGRTFQPDLVIINYFINDAEFTPDHREPGFLARNSFSYNFFVGRLDSVLRLFSQRSGWKEYYADLYGEDGNWQAARDAIGKIVEMARADGGDVLLVNYPEIRELTPYPFEEVTARLAAVANELDIPFLDLLPSVVDQHPSDLWVTVPDPHPNGFANGFFADALYRKLVDERMVPEPAGS